MALTDLSQTPPTPSLLAAADPAPVRLDGEVLSPGPLVLIGDHAGRAIPHALGDLGLPEVERRRHIAVDIGIEELGLTLAAWLGAPFLRQGYSRLVIDCNRAPGHPGSIAATSDGTDVPGNQNLAAQARRAREAEVFDPYHAAIGDMLDRRAAAALPTVLVSLHSFTPRMNGHDRPWHLGVLHNGHEEAFSRAVLARLRREPGLVIGDNEPYRMNETDYTVPRHAFGRGLPYLELEVRQDLVDPDGPGAQRMAGLLAAVLRDCIPPALTAAS